MSKSRIVLYGVLSVFVLSAHAGAEVNITVYHNDCAVITDERDVEFHFGMDTIFFRDVSAHLDPTSVSFFVDGRKEEIEVLNQQFHYDRADADSFTARYLGHTVEVNTVDNQELIGEFLSARNRMTLLLPEGNVRVIDWNDIHTFSLPQPIAAFYPRPTILWQVKSRIAATNTCVVRYLTRKINWRAEYSAILGKDDTTLQLAGWAAIDNQTGSTFKNARVKLVAGDANLVFDREQLRGARVPPRMRNDVEDITDLSAPSTPVESRDFFEHQMLVMNQSCVIDDGRVTQMPFLSPREVVVRKIYTFEPAPGGHQVRVNLDFENSAARGLGLFLPQGKLRVLAEDLDGSPELVGEGRITPTSVGENIRCVIGGTSEIVGKRVIMDRRRVDKRYREEVVEISLRNHKDQGVTVTVIEPMRGEWQITKSSHKHRRRDFAFVEFDIVVPPGEEKVLTYTVRSR